MISPGRILRLGIPSPPSNIKRLSIMRGEGREEGREGRVVRMQRSIQGKKMGTNEGGHTSPQKRVQGSREGYEGESNAGGSK